MKGEEDAVEEDDDNPDEGGAGTEETVQDLVPRNDIG